jgi:hypothetical protein
MRLFQNSGIYPAYLPRLARLSRAATSFAQMRAAFLGDRFGACHFLLPVLQGEPQAFFANGDHEPSQRRWAAEQGLPAQTALEDILLAQIEHHRTEVFYNLDPLRYGSAFVRRLPASVRHSLAWRAAPSPGADFEAYDRVVCNFPSILQSYRERGWKAAQFAPAHDPEMDAFAAQAARTVDVLFVGGYTRHHRQRAEVLEAVAALRRRRRIVFHLDRSRATRWAESALGRLLPLARHRRPPALRAVSAEPIFGRQVYEALAGARIVLNGAVDMAGQDRGNMRCWEAMGCGAAMVSDHGHYPDGMVNGQTMLTYGSAAEAVRQIESLLDDPARLMALAAAGNTMIRSRYSKAQQWQDFQQLVAGL